MVEQAMSMRKSVRPRQRIRDRRWIRQLPAYLVLSAWSLFTISGGASRMTLPPVLFVIRPRSRQAST